MFRRLAMPGFVVCVAVCLGVLLLWVRGVFYYDEIYFEKRMDVVLSSNQSFVAFTLDTRNPYSGLNYWAWTPAPSDDTRWGWTVTMARPDDVGWEGILDFSCKTSARPLGVGREMKITVPNWALCVASAAAAWGCLRRRGKRQWKIRVDVRSGNPRLRRRVVRFAIFSAAGVVLGAFVAWLGLEAHFYDPWWGVTACLPMPFMAGVIVLTRRRIRWSSGVLWMALELAGSACFFAATVEEIWHENNIYDEMNPLMMSLLFGFASFVCGSVIVLLMQMRSEAVKRGAYCPACGYCLIGVPGRICPECGRGFTLEELGICEAELVPGNIGPG